MSAREVLALVRLAFAEVQRPLRSDIVHCEHDSAWGGSLSGPCRECAEVVAFFDGKSKQGLSPKGLSNVAHGLAAFAPPAFRYWLPAFVEVALLEDGVGRRARESIEFRFGSHDPKANQAKRFAMLDREQFSAMREYFQYLLSDPTESRESIEEAIAKIGTWCSAREP